MGKKTDESYITLSVNRLVPGLFIDVGLHWAEHPFLFRRFRIKTAEEIAIIRSLVSEVKVCASKSTVGIGPENSQTTLEPVAELKQRHWDEKNRCVESARVYRQQRRDLARRYAETAKKVKNFNADLKSAPANAIRDAQEIANALALTVTQTSNILIDLINLPDSAFGGAAHCLNTTVLAVSLAKALQLPDAEIVDVATGALLHDVGMSRIPPNWLTKRGGLSRVQVKELENHPLYGASMVKNLAGVDVSARAQLIIAQHHELIDGTGFPQGVKGQKVSVLAQVVAIANIYDNLCNPANANDALNPKAAMATLYSKFSEKFKAELLNAFVRSMGIYPPGSLVKLSDDSLGLVINVDSTNLLKPNILLYNADVPKKEALLVRLSDMPGLTICDVLSADECPPDVKSYLGLQDRLAYFISEGTE